jgi:ribosomal protein S18 acetylase RimI-like enzyme
MIAVPAALELVVSDLKLSAALVPWDTEIFGFPVAQIRELEITNQLSAVKEYQKFQEWLDINRVQVASCRLPHNRLRESMFLEIQGFRFVEMVLHPQIEGIQYLNIPKDSLMITPVLESDLPVVQDIAERAFGYERYHVDPRLDPDLGNKRYGRWVKNSLHHPSQRLLKIMEGPHIVALFIVESKDDQSAYWHLTAISPQWQGQGYGQRVWYAMLRHHQESGQDAVMTTISARNISVLNLYAKLNFRFLSPDMTFHWVRSEK